MFETSVIPEKWAQIESLAPQLIKIVSHQASNKVTLQFINQLKAGELLDAVFLKKLPEGKAVVSIKGNKLTVQLPKELSAKTPNTQPELSPLSFNKGQPLKLQVENQGSRQALKIIPLHPLNDDLEGRGITTNLTLRGRSISKFLTPTNIAQTPIPNKTMTPTPIVTAKTIKVEPGNANNIRPRPNAETLQPAMKINLRGENTGPALPNNTSNQASAKNQLVNLDTLKPYLPARMPLTQMTQWVKSDILESPLMGDLKIKPELIVRLQKTLNLFLPREGNLPTATQIKKQVEASGVNYEAKIKQVIQSPGNGLARKELASDLKGLLMELNQYVDKTPKQIVSKTTHPLSEFRQAIKYAIDNIELNQLSSQVSKQENLPVVIQIPNPLSSGNKTIQLFVREDDPDNSGKDKGAKRGHNIAFFLNLSVLGNIKINSKIDQEQLSVTIDVENEDVAKFIKERSKDLKDRMKEINIATSVDCNVTQEVKPLNDGLIELLVSKNTSLVNIKT